MLRPRIPNGCSTVISASHGAEAPMFCGIFQSNFGSDLKHENARPIAARCLVDASIRPDGESREAAFTSRGVGPHDPKMVTGGMASSCRHDEASQHPPFFAVGGVFEPAIIPRLENDLSARAFIFPVDFGIPPFVADQQTTNDSSNGEMNGSYSRAVMFEILFAFLPHAESLVVSIHDPAGRVDEVQ